MSKMVALRRCCEWLAVECWPNGEGTVEVEVREDPGKRPTVKLVNPFPFFVSQLLFTLSVSSLVLRLYYVWEGKTTGLARRGLRAAAQCNKRRDGRSDARAEPAPKTSSKPNQT